MITQTEQKWLRNELTEGRGIGYAIMIGDDRQELPATIVRYLRSRINIHTQGDRELTIPLSLIHRILTSHPELTTKPDEPIEKWLTDYNQFLHSLQQHNRTRVRDYAQRIVNLRGDIRQTKKALASFKTQKTQLIPRTQEWFNEEIATIKKHADVAGVWLNEANHLIIETNNLPVLREGEPTGDQVGRLYIKILENTSEPIRIRNRDWLYDDHPHPHCDNDGDNTCFGEHHIGPLLMGSLYLLVDFLIRFYSEFYMGTPYMGYEEWLEERQSVNNFYEGFLGRKWKL